VSLKNGRRLGEIYEGESRDSASERKHAGQARVFGALKANLDHE
jgi:hypothetical protein